MVCVVIIIKDLKLDALYGNEVLSILVAGNSKQHGECPYLAVSPTMDRRHGEGHVHGRMKDSDLGKLYVFQDNLFLVTKPIP